MAKKVLVYITGDEQASLFDNIVFQDMGVDVVVSYTKVSVAGIAELVYDAVFARSQRDLKDLAFFVGGDSIQGSEELTDEIVRVLGELPEELQVSVAADPSGAYTTGASVVAKVKSVLGSLREARVLVLAGTGPVGMACSAFFGLEGAKVGLSSRLNESAVSSCGFINMRYGVVVDPFEVYDDSSLSSSIGESDVVVACGPPGVQILSKSAWEGVSSLKVLVDVNAVAPPGIEGVDADFDGDVVSDRVCFGSLGLGGFKMRVHKKLVNDLFRQKGVVFDLKGVHAMADRLV